MPSAKFIPGPVVSTFFSFTRQGDKYQEASDSIKAYLTHAPVIVPLIHDKPILPYINLSSTMGVC